MFENVIIAVQTGDINGLTELGTQTLNQMQYAIFDEIKETGITKALPVVNKYINNMGNILDETQRNILQTELLKIPERIMQNSLRG